MMGEIKEIGGMFCNIRVDLISCISLVRIILETRNRKHIKRT